MRMQDNDRIKAIGRELKVHGQILGGFVLIIWLVELIDRLLLDSSLDALGIRPRIPGGLSGVLFAPFLHHGFAHVAANTLPFLVLGWLVMLGGLPQFFFVTIFTMLVSGLGTWLIGPANTVHVGASGLIFGYVGFLLFSGYFQRSCRSIAWAVIVFLFYGGALLGVLPQGGNISWQVHLFGFIAGGAAAYLWTTRSPAGIP